MYDVIIIGSGPAGHSAAIYTSRAMLKTLILTGSQPGGQLTTTTEIENFPGFPKGILGTQLMADMEVQAKRFGTEVIQGTVSRVKARLPALERSDSGQGKGGSVKGEGEQKGFIVEADGKTYDGKSVIVATGASAMYLGLPSEERLKGKGVSGCATCDGFFFKGKDIVVVGGGDTAMEEATFLTKFASKVTIIHRREEFRASAIMLERAKKDPKITFLTNKIIEEILGDTAVTGIRMKDTLSGKVETYSTQGVFLAIGHKPSTGFLKDVIELDEKGYVRLKSKIQNPKSNSAISGFVSQTETSVPGIFAAGDCVDSQYRQAAVAAGMGVMAALDVQHYLEL